MIGETISHYRVVERLGGGGMGVVYRAEDTRLGRDVALKFLPPELTRDEAARERFTLEARAASALDHASICTIHDIDETADGQLFIAMAFYAGETLKARLARGPLEPGKAIDIARQIAAGLERAHESGIVHRDIKPANLMLTERGEVKILDFGIAKLAGEASLTRTGTTLGTLAYMAPEQVEGGEISPATDLWGLGAVLYEMLTGMEPFPGKRESERVASILAVDPEPPRARREGIPEALEALVLDLLRKDPGERPADAGEVVARLEALAHPMA
ncbi:MAG: serine/threonine-protein kinase, partial [Gemmatimonadota bacterium]|nr:serine/threonine-protein kinase [Gemmatimonadota bacterium]